MVAVAVAAAVAVVVVVLVRKTFAEISQKIIRVYE